MRIVVVFAGMLVLFSVAVALVIATAIATGGLLHSWVPAIDLGTAVLIAMGSFGIVMFLARQFVELMAANIVVKEAADNDDEREDEGIEDAEVFVQRVSEALMNRAGRGSPYSNSTRFAHRGEAT